MNRSAADILNYVLGRYMHGSRSRMMLSVLIPHHFCICRCFATFLSVSIHEWRPGRTALWRLGARSSRYEDCLGNARDPRQMDICFNSTDFDWLLMIRRLNSMRPGNWALHDAGEQAFRPGEPMVAYIQDIYLGEPLSTSPPSYRRELELISYCCSLHQSARLIGSEH